MFVFFSSCSKFEEEQNQTNIVPNINEAQAKIGGENWFEDYVNIEDFNGIQVEDNVTYQKHQKALQKLLSYNKFPNDKSEYDLENISYSIAHYYNTDWTENRSYLYSGLKNIISNNIGMYYEKTKPFVECFYSVRYDSVQERKIYKHFLPKELDTLKRAYREKLFSYYHPRLIRKEVPLWYYSIVTGIPKEDFKNLRVISRNDPYDNSSYWYYQMPYKDNYKDYQNDTQEVENIDELKKFIKKGSLIFIFDKPKEKLDEIDGLYFGHMMIITDCYTHFINEYNPLTSYNLVKKNEDFFNVHYFYKESIDENISFAKYLKHFVFIEAQKDKMKNQNKEQGFERDNGVMLTSGNDKRFQEYLKEATCVAVVNLNDGYNYSHPNLVDNMINNALNQLGKEYNKIPQRHDFFEKHYCSGLVWFSFFNEDKYPSLKLLLPKHRTLPVNLGYWYMPRTVCNSPFVYTRVWYKKE